MSRPIKRGSARWKARKLGIDGAQTVHELRNIYEDHYDMRGINKVVNGPIRRTPVDITAALVVSRAPILLKIYEQWISKQPKN